jgi:hypothetical protein
MNPERWQQIQVIFDSAVKRGPTELDGYALRWTTS